VAGSAAEELRRAAVVARVGSRTISVADLEDRLARVPRFQLRTFGRDAQEIRRRFLDEVLVRDALLAEGAASEHIDKGIVFEQAAGRALSTATLQHLRSEIGSPAAIPLDEVRRYFDANPERYVGKPRLSIWRILCRSRDEAALVLAEAKKDGSVQTFTRLAREHSADKATSLRGGNLGFLDPKGISNEPGVSADAAIVVAAEGVKDGEIVPTPVQEGTGFSVVWRRGTIAGASKTFEQATPMIRDSLVAERRELAEKALIDRLRAAKVRDEDVSLLGSFDVKIDDGTLVPRKHPHAAN